MVKTRENLYKWNLACLAAVELGWGVGASFLSPGAVLPMLATSMGATLAQVGLLPGLATIANTLPQLLAAHRTAGLTRPLGFVTRWHFLPTLAFLPLAALVARGGHGPARVALLYLALSLWYLATGYVVPVWIALVDNLSGSARRGQAFGALSVAGLLGGTLGAWLAGKLLAHVGAPACYALCALAAFVSLNAANVAWFAIEEPEPQGPGPAGAGRPGLRAYLVGLTGAVRENAEFTRFLLAQQLMSLFPVLGSFYMLYGRDRLGASPETVLSWAGVSMASQAAGSLFYGAWGDRLGARTTLLGSQLLLMAAMATALSVRTPPGMTAVSVLLGFFFGTFFNARTSTVLELAQGGEAAAYLAVTNLVSTPASVVVPALAGWAMDRYGFRPVLSWALAGTALGTLYLAAAPVLSALQLAASRLARTADVEPAEG